MSRYTTLTYTDGDGVEQTTLQANYGTYGTAHGEKWFLCTICGASFPKSKMSFKGGIAYCIPHGCYLDKNEPLTGGKI
jgi:hypothetical protein